MPAPLAALLPAPGAPALSADEVLSRFVEYAAAQGLTLYPHQEEAILELLGGKHLLLATPTGSGKSLVALALLFKARAENKTGYYTCPIKALVNEKFFQLCQAFGPESVGMATGDAAINADAPLLCCTAEVLANRCLRESRHFVDYVVMDEFHYYGDKDRGTAWQVPLLSLPDTTFLLMSATLGDTHEVQSRLAAHTGKEAAQVKSAVRPVPLDFSYVESPLHETVKDLLERGRAPVYLVNFTQRAAVEQAQNLLSVDFSSKEDKERLKAELVGARFDTPFGKDLKRFLLHGLGVHHAGLLPKYRLMVEKLAQTGLLKVISGTDTLGVGVNIPIRTVLFTQLCKFSGEKTHVLSVREFLQVAGRAGRKGFDEHGYVVVQAPEHVIENKLLEAKRQAGKKVVKKTAPTKGYAHWDKPTFDRLVQGQPEPLVPRFVVTHGMLLHLLQANREAREGGYKKLVQLVGKSHAAPGSQRHALKQAAVLFRALRNAGLVELLRRTPTHWAYVAVRGDLQKEFSLNQTLSLYLVETLGRLDRALPTYGLDVLSLVESVLESPDAVLWAQLDRLKGEKVAELKAQGMEYDDRMAELEKLEWPKPNADFIYATFNEFAAHHPWVGQENIRPKSVARDMFERCATFQEYVREYGLQRTEGVLLRYLSDTYRTLVQSVPVTAYDEVLEDVIAFLHVTLRTTDSSLLDEWERLKDPEALRAELLHQAPAAMARRVDLLANPRAFAARVRAELHRLVKALAQKDYEAAAAALRPGSEWTAERLEAELAPYFAAHPTIDTTPASRAVFMTQLAEDAPRLYTARQSLLDPTGERDWFVECALDLREPPAEPDQPLVDWVRLGS